MIVNIDQSKTKKKNTIESRSHKQTERKSGWFHCSPTTDEGQENKIFKIFSARQSQQWLERTRRRITATEPIEPKPNRTITMIGGGEQAGLASWRAEPYLDCCEWPRVQPISPNLLGHSNVLQCDRGKRVFFEEEESWTPRFSNNNASSHAEKHSHKRTDDHWSWWEFEEDRKSNRLPLPPTSLFPLPLSMSFRCMSSNHPAACPTTNGCHNLREQPFWSVWLTANQPGCR